MSDDTFPKDAASRAFDTVKLPGASIAANRSAVAKSQSGRKAAAKVQAALDKSADAIAEKAAATSDKARDILSAASDRVQATVDKIDPFVTERPYATFGIGLAAGLVLGLLIAGRGPKVIYVKPRNGAH